MKGGVKQRIGERPILRLRGFTNLGRVRAREQGYAGMRRGRQSPCAGLEISAQDEPRMAQDRRRSWVSCGGVGRAGRRCPGGSAEVNAIEPML